MELKRDKVGFHGTQLHVTLNIQVKHLSPRHRLGVTLTYRVTANHSSLHPTLLHWGTFGGLTGDIRGVALALLLAILRVEFLPGLTQ